MQDTMTVLVLLSAVMHAAWNAYLHNSDDRLRQVGLMALPYGLFALVGVLALPLPAPECWPYAVVAALLQVGYSLTLIRAYQHGDLSQMYPIARGASPLLVTLGALLLAGERLTPHASTGIMLVSSGILLLAFNRRLQLTARGVPYALLTGCIIASYTVTDGMGVRLSGNSLAYLAWVYMLWNLPMLAIIARKRGGLTNLFTNPRATRNGLMGGTLSLIAYSIVVYAMQYLPMGMVSALRELSCIFALLIGRIVLKEKLTPQRIVACLMVCVGVILIKLP